MTILTRRAFGGLAGGAASALACSGTWELIAVQPAAASFSDLADQWRDATQILRDLVWSGATSERYLAARQVAVRASIRLMDTPATTTRDVLIKYYVLYECTHFTCFDLDYTEARFDAWCKQLEQEGDDLDMVVTPFWGRRWIDPKCMKDRSTTDWSVVYPWRIKSRMSRA